MSEGFTFTTQERAIIRQRIRSARGAATLPRKNNGPVPRPNRCKYDMAIVRRLLAANVGQPWRVIAARYTEATGKDVKYELLRSAYYHANPERKAGPK